LKKVALSGGPPVVIASGVTAPFGASWESDDTILFGQPRGIFRVSANGDGVPELVIPAEPGERLFGPELLPDGDSVLFSATTGTWDEAEIVAQPLSTGARTSLVRGGSDAHYIPTGHLVYALANGLFAIAFDPAMLEVSGESVPVEQGVRRSAAGTTGSAFYGIAADGTLIFVSDSSGTSVPAIAVWVDRDGTEESTGLEEPAGYECSDPVLSPGGTQFAYDCATQDMQNVDIWTWSLNLQTKAPLTSESGFEYAPVWSPDSLRIAYGSRDEGLFVRAADGSTDTTEKILEGARLTPWNWLDTNELIYTENHGANSDIGLVGMTGDHEHRMLLATRFSERRPAVSPDGHWLAYQTDESGHWEIVVRPFPNVDAGRSVISSGGGEDPRWSADSRSLFFIGPTSLMEKTIGTDSLSPDKPKALFDIERYLLSDANHRYDVSPDGQRFLMFRWRGIATGGVDVDDVVIVTHWVDDLVRRLPAH
jgi:serine/threonine-protein kinase